MRNVKNGWFIRYIHSSGASCLFIMIYCHMLRAIYYRTFRNTLTWLTGLVLFFLMMATGFLGYVIVWGQMCEKDIYISLGWRIFQNKSNRFCFFRYLKQLVIYALLKLIWKNLVDISIIRRKKLKLLGVLIVVSNVSFGIKAFFYNFSNCIININKWIRGNF